MEKEVTLSICPTCLWGNRSMGRGKRVWINRGWILEIVASYFPSNDIDILRVVSLSRQCLNVMLQLQPGRDRPRLVYSLCREHGFSRCWG